MCAIRSYRRRSDHRSLHNTVRTITFISHELGGFSDTPYLSSELTSPLDLTKVRLQASGDKRMIASMQKTVRTAGFVGLFDGITGTWLRQMSYSLCRFWAYDESKKIVGAGKDAPAWKLALAGSMGEFTFRGDATSAYSVCTDQSISHSGRYRGICRQSRRFVTF